MRITRKQLQDLINEEISEALLMSENSRLTEGLQAQAGVDIYHASAKDLIMFTKAFAGLGRMVSEQLEKILDDPQAECNPSAIELIKERIGGMNIEIDKALGKWQTEYFESGEGARI